MRLLVLTSEELAPAFQIAGTETVSCLSAADAQSRLRHVLTDGFQGVVAVHQPFLDAMPADLLDTCEQLEATLVIGIPDGARRSGAESRLSGLHDLLREAVGYEITFKGEGEKDGG